MPADVSPSRVAGRSIFFRRCDGWRDNAAVLGAPCGFLAGLRWEKGRRNQFSQWEKGLWGEMWKAEPQEIQTIV